MKCVLPALFMLFSLTSTFSVADEATGQSPTFTKLFNGSTLDGWKHSGNWKVDDGTVTRTGGGGSLIYTGSKVPDDFELQFEFQRYHCLG